MHVLQGARTLSQGGVVTDHSYQINGESASATAFVAAACQPQQSVVVEACAGSGKTWLLVARMLRLLLAGATPGELLAITFTKKAAQEMRQRLLQLLKELAVVPDDQVVVMLRERGVEPDQLAAALPKARMLYQAVLSSGQALNLDTFHSWFFRLIQLAPLNAQIPQGYALLENIGPARREAWRRLMESATSGADAQTREALLWLFEHYKNSGTMKLLDTFLDKRSEWWACAGHDDQHGPLQWLADLCADDGVRDARLTLWETPGLVADLARIAAWLGKGTGPNQRDAVPIETALTAGASLENFDVLLDALCTKEDKPRKCPTNKALTDAMTSEADRFATMPACWVQTAEALLHLVQRSQEIHVMAMNKALFAAGSAYIALFQDVKAEQRVLDFSDLEWLAYKLMQSAQHAAYVQSRLDARYKHILLDEFQDTNPLQWSIVRCWLDAYGADADPPSMFVVGDPKQSIYRFRRADPRVFDAASRLLQSRGALLLRTNQTRRNAPAILEVLNSCMQANPLFVDQSTTSDAAGTVWRLPLVDNSKAGKEATSTSNAPTTATLRNPLTTPDEEAEESLRLQEGRQVAQAVLQARHLAAQRGAPLKWSDIMMLVRRRGHLEAYETAFREAGIPFVTSRRGGLLESLEVSDVIALLKFLITPNDNLALAQVLRSPMFAVADTDLIALAQTPGTSWWLRLQHLAQVAGTHAHLAVARDRLSRWMDAAHHLPVHDLLDRVYHDGDLLHRYAQHAPYASRNQAVGNLAAFIELALNLDAGRYPSLPKFIDALNQFRIGDEGDAPDESAVDSGSDALRILTIHSAKGLQARLVVLVDANHSDGNKDSAGILIDWPLDEVNARRHFSAFGAKAERGHARQALFDQELALEQQENWNLLYVALTRAEQGLIVSGIENNRAGNVLGSWYERLAHVPVWTLDDDAMQHTSAIPEQFELTSFVAQPLPAPRGLAVSASVPDTQAQLEGTALHALMEQLTQDWPVQMPAVASVARWLGCSDQLAGKVRAQAMVILGNPQLERFFNPAMHRFARNEMDLLHDNQLMRLDRVVVFDDAVWVLDYKRRLLDLERVAYQTQLQQYRQALQAVYSGQKICTALILTDGNLVEFG